MISTKHRSEAPEIMDDFDLEGETLRDALDKIASINQLLGGNSITLSGVKSLLHNQPQAQKIRIVDVGCGNGDMLRSLANYGRQKQLNFVLTGIDANDFTITHARNLSAAYPEISYQCADIFDPQTLQDCEIVLCTLTLHHFKDQEIIQLMQHFKEKAKLGIVINDLQRSALAYYLFKALCFVFGLNELSREDGLVSILRGFKKADLRRYTKQLGLKYCSIKWKWAFRYQWLIKHNECKNQSS